jgi:hypothetical protein
MDLCRLIQALAVVLARFLEFLLRQGKERPAG